MCCCLTIVTIVENGHNQLKNFWPILISCVLRTAELIGSLQFTRIVRSTHGDYTKRRLTCPDLWVQGVGREHAEYCWSLAVVMTVHLLFHYISSPCLNPALWVQGSGREHVEYCCSFVVAKTVHLFLHYIPSPWFNPDLWVQGIGREHEVYCCSFLPLKNKDINKKISKFKNNIVL